MIITSQSRISVICKSVCHS